MTNLRKRSVYNALQGDQFRLLKMKPGTGDDALLCDIQTESLGSNPVYQAVSYCWGTDPQSRQLLCGKHFFAITSDLAIALQHIRSATDERTLWIDQICIDQEDEAEKAIQVNIMRRIYSQATEVLIWLGAGQEQMNLAMRTIIETSQQLSATFIRVQIATSHGLETEVRANEAAVQLTPPDSPEWTAFRAFFHLPWFTRVWIYQELKVARKATLMYGATCLTWARLVAVYELVQQRSLRLPSGLTYMSNVPKVVMIMYFGNQLNLSTQDPLAPQNIGQPTQELFNLVRSLRRNGATDPRDKIYALLGVANDLMRYVQKWITQDTSAQCTATSRNVNVLPEKGKQGWSRCFELPSWCPDFRSVSYLNNLRVENGPEIIRHGKNRAYNATGASSVTLIASDSMLLSLHGRHVGKIAHLSQPAGNMVGDTSIGEAVLTGGVWNKFAEAHSVEGRYVPTDEPMLLAFSILRICDYLPNETSAELRRQRKGQRKGHLNYDMLQPGNITYSATNGLVHAAREEIGVRILRSTTRQCMFFTDSGYMGLCHRSCEIGDDIYLLMGNDMPTILRKLDTGHFQWKGLSYVHGIMDGEFLLQFRENQGSMTDSDWLQSLSTEHLPFSTEVITLT